MLLPRAACSAFALVPRKLLPGMINPVTVLKQLFSKACPYCSKRRSPRVFAPLGSLRGFGAVLTVQRWRECDLCLSRRQTVPDELCAKLVRQCSALRVLPHSNPLPAGESKLNDSPWHKPGTRGRSSELSRREDGSACRHASSERDTGEPLRSIGAQHGFCGSAVADFLGGQLAEDGRERDAAVGQSHVQIGRL